MVMLKGSYQERKLQTVWGDLRHDFAIYNTTQWVTD